MARSYLAWGEAARRAAHRRHRRPQPRLRSAPRPRRLPRRRDRGRHHPARRQPGRRRQRAGLPALAPARPALAPRSSTPPVIPDGASAPIRDQPPTPSSSARSPTCWRWKAATTTTPTIPAAPPTTASRSPSYAARPRRRGHRRQLRRPQGRAEGDPADHRAPHLPRPLLAGRPRCPDLPPPLAFFHFDAAVNQGVTGAARMLQQAVGADIDGEIGPLTLAAVAAPSRRTQTLVALRRHPPPALPQPRPLLALRQRLARPRRRARSALAPQHRTRTIATAPSPRSNRRNHAMATQPEPTTPPVRPRRQVVGPAP